MARAIITNRSNSDQFLPPPYGILVRAGQSVVVGDDPATVRSNLGGDQRILGMLAVGDQPDSAVPTPGVGIGGIDKYGAAELTVIRKAFLATDPGDIVIFDANAPFRFRIIDAFLKVTTGVAGTATLRDTKAGGGAALSSAMSTASAVTVRDAGVAGGSAVVPVGGTLALNRSAPTCAGEVNILAVPA